jgi:hypothetical protein
MTEDTGVEDATSCILYNSQCNKSYGNITTAIPGTCVDDVLRKLGLTR